MRDILVFNEKNIPEDLVNDKFYFVTGSIVISRSYFKRVITGLRTIFGGRIRSLESIVDLGRREAVLRMKKEAKSYGADVIFNVRFETAMIGEKDGKKGGFCTEFLVYGSTWSRK
jgi:uncharacterized protein YbjQ (UPF0145 family)